MNEIIEQSNIICRCIGIPDGTFVPRGLIMAIEMANVGDELQYMERNFSVTNESKVAANIMHNAIGDE